LMTAAPWELGNAGYLRGKAWARSSVRGSSSGQLRSVALSQRLRRVPRHHAVARRQKVAAVIPPGGFHATIR
jgi:hypothetical protein